MFLAFRICACLIFSKKGKDIFLFGVLPSKYSGSVAGLQFGLGFAKTIFWGKDFAKPRLIYFGVISDFVRAEEGFGEESARALGFCFWRAGYFFQSSHEYIHDP